MSNPNCNYNLSSGEFYSKKKEIYDNQLKDNDKKYKIYSLGLYASIVIFLISFILFIVFFTRNKDLLKEKENKLTSVWSTSVIVCIVFSILSFCFGIFTGIFMAKYSQTIKSPLIDDEIRPCFSQIKNKLISPNSPTSSNSSKSPQPNNKTTYVPSTKISGNVTGSQAGKITSEQNILSNTSITGTGLDQIKGLEINTQSGQTVDTNQEELRTMLNNMGTDGSFKYEHNQDNKNEMNNISSLSGNASRDPGNTLTTNTTNNSNTSGSVTVYR
jgi:uncharacterized protein YneF (UPF0154 family)